MALDAKGSDKMVAPQEQQTSLKVPEVTPNPTQVMSASVSAFTSAVEETDDTPNVTASGTYVHPGTAACPTRYPFGTRILVAGKTYVCEDRMALRFRAGNYFDLWMASRTSALQWGRRSVSVEVLP